MFKFQFLSIHNRRVDSGTHSKYASEVTWERLRPTWRAFSWRTIIYTVALGVVLGFIGGVISGVVGRPDLATYIAAILSWLGSIPVSILVMSTVLKKQYESFAIRFVAPPARDQPQAFGSL